MLIKLSDKKADELKKYSESLKKAIENAEEFLELPHCKSFLQEVSSSIEYKKIIFEDLIRFKIEASKEVELKKESIMNIFKKIPDQIEEIVENLYKALFIINDELDNCFKSTIITA